MTPPVRPESPSPFLLALMRAGAQRDASQVTPQPTTRQPSRIEQALYRNITPVGYAGHTSEVLSAIRDAITPGPINTSQPVRDTSLTNGFARLYGESGLKEREDAWRQYLGFPQQNGTFRPSQFKPTYAKDQNATYYALNNFVQHHQLDDPANMKALVDWTTDPNEQRALKESGWLPRAGAYQMTGRNEPVMGHFQISHGADEQNRPYIAYYDKWDLDTRGGSMAGKPYEIYDRVYYDPQTYKVLPQPTSVQPAPQPVPAQLNLAAFNQAVSAAAARAPRQTF